MDEEKNNKAEEQEGATSNNDDGFQPETTNALKEADRRNEAFKAENDRREAILKREEELEARRTLGGQSSGAVSVEPKKETPAEYAKRIQEDLRTGKLQ